ncbi:MAG: rRNA maturation RNase YbeY [Patescibacteria group bacterium]|nr:rRNA maturation RNase YbeY [Patescibacteria group bacterium]
MPTARVSICNGTRARAPRAPFGAIKDAVLGKRYSLCLNWIGPGEMRKLNKIYRGKDKPTDILSFPLSKTEGEIYICMSESRKQARAFGRAFENFVVFLFIHGCVHLKGYDHGATMEKLERRTRSKFGV